MLVPLMIVVKVVVMVVLITVEEKAITCKKLYCKLSSKAK